MLQLLSLGSIVDNQSVVVAGTSDLELGLLEDLAAGVDLLVGLDDTRLNVRSSGQLDELLDVLDFLSHYVCMCGGYGVPTYHHDDFFHHRFKFVLM